MCVIWYLVILWSVIGGTVAGVGFWTGATRVYSWFMEVTSTGGVSSSALDYTVLDYMYDMYGMTGARERGRDVQGRYQGP